MVAAGCASREFRPLEFSPPVRLQDPLPGQAIVYLLRVPHDPAPLDVSIDGRRVASLPPSTYTVATLAPGEHTLSAARPGEEAKPPASLLTVAAGERRFIYTSVPSNTQTTLGFAGALPLFGRSQQPAGARAWIECSELDAQGLMSTARLVLPG
jgi:hypothetical protein